MIRSGQTTVGTTQTTLAEGGGDGAIVVLLNKGAATVYVGGAVNERQSVALTGGPTGGTFTLTYSGQTTSPGIPYNATAAQVQAALEALSNIAVGDVYVVGGDLPNGLLNVEFTGSLAGIDVAQLTGSGASLTGGSAPGVSIATTVAGGVTTANGFELASGSQVTVTLAAGDKAVGITSASTASVHVLSHGN